MSNEPVEITTPSGVIRIIPRKWDKYMTSFRYQLRPRVYVWGDSDNETVIENLNNRTRRPHAEYKKHALRILAEAGVGFDGTKMKWNQYAGCSCPCSPAFCAPKQVLTYNDVMYHNYDLSILIKDLGNVDYTKQGRLYSDADAPSPSDMVTTN